MSIMKNVNYKQTGGVIAPGLPNIDTTSLDTAYKDVIDWSADPQNIPQYYTAPTVAQFDPLQTTAHQGLIDAAGQYDTITQDLVSEYTDQLDPNSTINQQLANQAAQSSANAFYGAGTPGSARGQYAGALAAQDAVRANRENALQQLGAQRGSLTGAADITAGVGGQRYGLSQKVIDEDIKRFNYGQLSPQQFADRILGLSAQQEALKQGNVGVDAGSPGFGGIFGGLLSSALGGGLGGSGGIGNILGGLGLNEGGEVPGMDPMMGPGMASGMGPDPMMQDPMMSPEPPMVPGMDPMMGGDPMMTDVTQITAIAPEETSEIDKIEGILQGLALENPNIKVKRKTKGGK